METIGISVMVSIGLLLFFFSRVTLLRRLFKSLQKPGGVQMDAIQFLMNIQESAG